MGQEGTSADNDQPLQPFELPEALRDFLRQAGDYVLITNTSNQGTIYVVKAPEKDIASMQGNIPMQVTHELYRLPQAPVIRSVVRIYDDPSNPVVLETFTNIRDEEQRQNFATLSGQLKYIFIFYNEQLTHRLTKSLDNTHREQTASLFRQALLASSRIPDRRYDFDQAKAAVMRSTSLQ